jgi:hypothetical protein
MRVSKGEGGDENVLVVALVALVAYVAVVTFVFKNLENQYKNTQSV